jgi:hypothetical protein
MSELQNRWYNCLVDALSLDPAMFQIVQPSAPLAPADAALWAYLNVIPPASLTFNRAICHADRMFDRYAAMVSQVRFPQASLEHAIGPQAFEAWSAHLAAQRSPPADHQLPALFHNWAARNAIGVASAGVASLSQTASADAARRALLPYQGPNAKPVDFTATYADLLDLLAASPSVSLSFDSRLASADVSGTWTGGADTGVDGLWAGSGIGSDLSKKFSASTVSVDASFERYAIWTATPGPWYSSTLFNMAFSSAGPPLWPADANPSWNDLFGPDGSMRRLVASLVVMDGGNIKVTSDAVFEADEQKTILENAPLGIWPFYIPAGGAVSSVVTFPQAGGMEIGIVTRPKNPLVIGDNVLSVGRYLGHGSG